jgi:hypothetical protein
MNWLREPDAEPLPGYRLIAPLGTGGFGEVWKCSAPGNILKAIKFVYGNLNSLDGDAYRAEQEFKAMQRIKEVRHPFVLSMERIDIVEGDLAIVMELADMSLHDRLVACQQKGLPGIPRDELLGYLRDAADGLDHLNEKHNLQHLDVKPRNLFVVGGRVKVADFGLVKTLERQSSSGLMAGVTPIYAAPETFGGKITKQSDQYSLAVVYMELLTGARPFNGKNIRALALQHVSEEPDFTPIPEHDRPAMKRAMAKEPEDRFPSCLAFIKALRDAKTAGAAEFARAAPRPAPSAAGRPRKLSGSIHDSDAEASGQSLCATQAQMEVGILRPTILIGLGSFGRRALLDVRCRMLDRFGDLGQVPLFRFLYVDSDPEAVHKALYEAPEVALSSTEVFPLPLQPVSNYRRRALESINDWLPREKLYAMPRSLQPQGSRALGRLAFHDNYLRFMTRIRRELQIATHPEALAQSVAQTGMTLRDNKPRVVVMASSAGGSGGLLADMAYAVMRQMSQLHLAVTPPTLFLYCGAPTDPATPKPELANVYATLTELHHFSDPTISFVAQYGPDGQKFSDGEAPFEAIYLLALDNRSPEAQRGCVAHLANYLNHELTTPLGMRLETSREARPPAATRYRSFGTHSVWYPRGLLLRSAARQVCERLVQEWQHPEFNGPADEIEAACREALTDPNLNWEALQQQIERAAQSPDGTPPELLGRLLNELADDADRAETQTSPAVWTRHAMEQMDEWVGTQVASPEQSMLRRSRFSVLYNQATVSLAEQWEKTLLSHISHLTDRPGRRIAAAEEALRRMIDFCEQAAAAQSEVVEQQHDMVDVAREQIRVALEACRTGAGGLRGLFGGGPQRGVRHFLDELRVFSYARLAEDTLEAGVQFFQKLRGRLEERLNDLGFCRQRLRNLQQALAEPADAAHEHNGQDTTSDSSLPGDSFGTLFQGASTVQVVLPEGATTLEQAAMQCVLQVKPEDYVRLDEAIQTLVLAPLGGLHAICQKNSDLSRLMGGPLVEQTAAVLGDLLPVSDVAEAEISAATRKGQALSMRIKRIYDEAIPMVQPRGARYQTAYLLHPTSSASQRFAADARALIPDLEVVPSASHTDLTICREQGYLSSSDMNSLLASCRAAYEEAGNAPSASPHARFDIAEWLPLVS